MLCDPSVSGKRRERRETFSGDALTFDDSATQKYGRCDASSGVDMVPVKEGRDEGER